MVSFAKHALSSLRRPVLTVGAAVAVAALCVAGLAVTPASASAARPLTASSSGFITLQPPTSTLQQITSFGTNPTGLEMYLYVPQHVNPHPAIVVALHYCGGSGPAFFNGTEFASLADVY
ncbi:MAG TPA: hypothetical protein VF838_11900, partial [Trebonia sp.]